MSTPKHTPGPWTVEDRTERLAIFPTVGDAEIASITWEDDEDEDVALADAHLIAAAPDLLEALKAFVAAPLDGAERADAFYAARAAIAKAEGRS